MNKSVQIRMIVDDGEVPFTIGHRTLLTESEVSTLRGRVVKYLNECRQRRGEEARKERTREEKATTVCMHCNGSGKVRKRVFRPAAGIWVYASGTMLCTHCSERPAKAEVTG